ITAPPTFNGFRQLLIGLAYLLVRDVSADEPPADEGEAPCADPREVHERKVLGDRVLVLLAPGDNLRLELSIPVSRYPELYFTDPLDTKPSRIGPIPMIGVSIDAFVFLSAQMMG